MAEVVEVLKLGKKERNTAKAYRPIALIFIVAKGLKRIVASRFEEVVRSLSIFLK